MLGLVMNGEVISISGIPGAAGALAACDGRNAPWENEENVGTELFQVLFLPAAKALAESHQKQQRTHSPGDAKHGEKRAQLVRPQGGQRLADNIEEELHLHSNSPCRRGDNRGPIPVERSQLPSRHHPVLRFLRTFGSQGSKEFLGFIRPYLAMKQFRPK